MSPEREEASSMESHADRNESLSSSEANEGTIDHNNNNNSMIELDPHEQPTRPSVYRHESFIMHFATSKGPPQIVILCLLLAMGFGSTIGVVPAVVTDRYARLFHGYTNAKNCADYAMEHKPAACLEGSNDAQSAAALANFISNVLTFLSSSMMGSISDEKGRKGILLLGLFLSLWHPFFLVLLQLKPSMSPFWYYASNSITGLVSWIAVALSALADVMPSKWRAPSFGLLLAGFSLGFALSPILAVLLNHFAVSVLSFAFVVVGFIMTIFFLPETLPPQVALSAALARIEQQAILAEEDNGQNEFAVSVRRFCWSLTRPMRELSILGRNRLFITLSTLAFFSGMVAAGDRTLLLYYLEERLAFDDNDVALTFFLIGILGILVQGVLIKPINDCIGERLVVAVAFFFGSVTNFLYGTATTKSAIFIAVCISSFGGLSFPTISAIKSNNVAESEQGRIQGALYSIQALAAAVGPMTMRYVYTLTKDSSYPGAMFIFAACLYLFAVGCAFALPKEQANSRSKGRDEYELIDDDNDEEPPSHGDHML